MENPPLRILMVEDSEEDALLLLRQLRRENMNVQSRRVDNAASMKQALETETFDAVLSDHNMPQFDSFGALQVLQEAGQDLPFVVVSASIGEQTAVELMRCGAHDFIMKDNTARLAPAIQRELREAQNRRERREALESLRRQNRELETLNRRLQSLILASKKIAACPNIRSMGKAALQEFAAIMAAEGGSLFIKEAENLILAFSLDPDHVPAALPFPLKPDSVLGRVWNSREPLVIGDIEKQNEISRSGWSGYQNGSLLALPLRNTRGEMLGIVALHNKIDRPFAAQDREMGMILGSLFCETRRALAIAEDLRQSEEAFRALAENSLDTIMRFDEECRHLYVNPVVEKISGIPPADFIGKTHEELGFPKDLCHLCEEAIRKVFHNKSVNRIEFRLPGGTWIDWLLMPEFGEQGRVRSVLAASRDISERRQMEEDRQRLMTAIEQAGEIFIITDATGSIEYVNPAFVKITGYSREEVLGNNPRILKSDKHDDAFYRQLWSTISSGQTWRGRLHNKRKDGSLYIEDATISPVRNQERAIVHYIGVKRDVTHEVELENQLRQAQKMEAIGQLAGGIAHDFNNILAAINGYSELLRDQIRSGEPPDGAFLEEVLKAGDRAKSLVKQILTFSRQTEQDKRPLKIGRIVKEALKLLRGALPSTIEIRQNLDLDSDTIIADATQIHQVVMNLCTNAFHAMKDGGELTVGLDALSLDPGGDRAFSDLAPGPYVRLTVSDTGQGIAPENLTRIFDPFFTTKGRGEGTGMGLSVVHGIVKAHGGTISVRSEVGRGTVFEVLFPRVALEPPREEASSEPLPTGRERVLLVDDEAFVLDVMARMMITLGYSVTTQKNGAEAFDLLTQQENPFDLIVTDLTMPIMTGIELSRRLRQAHCSIPVVLCTGYSEHIGEAEAREIGLAGVLKKPVSMRELAATVRAVLDGKAPQ